MIRADTLKDLKEVLEKLQSVASREIFDNVKKIRDYMCMYDKPSLVICSEAARIAIEAIRKETADARTIRKDFLSFLLKQFQNVSFGGYGIALDDKNSFVSGMLERIAYRYELVQKAENAIKLLDAEILKCEAEASIQRPGSDERGVSESERHNDTLQREEYDENKSATAPKVSEDDIPFGYDDYLFAQFFNRSSLKDEISKYLKLVDRGGVGCVNSAAQRKVILRELLNFAGVKKADEYV